MESKERLKHRLLYWDFDEVFVGTFGGTKLMMHVDPAAEKIDWYIQEGDHHTTYMNFEEAVDYYLSVT